MGSKIILIYIFLGNEDVLINYKRCIAFILIPDKSEVIL